MTAHRDEFFHCPACKTAMQPQGPRLVCSSCEGVLVPNQFLEQMLNEMSPDDQRPLERRLLDGSAIPRPCPRCVTDMTPHTMYSVTIDRCAEHGVWFDGSELATILNANGQSFAAREFEAQPSGSLGGILGQTLRALFSPFLRKKKLEQDIAATSPSEKKTQS